MRSRWFWLLVLVLQSTHVLAQSAMPTSNILTRVLMVESRYGRGTIFSLDVDQREYWVTAKHILTGAEHPPYGSIAEASVQLRILNPAAEAEEWIPVDFAVVNQNDDKDVDVVVLAPREPVLNAPLPSLPADSSGAFLGGDCEFLGFPFGGGWRAPFDNGKSFWMPYIKHCVMSALTHEGKKVWVLDGINNPGFSGGPVIFLTGPQQKVMAVVSGYLTEPTDVVPSTPDKAPPQKSKKTKHRKPPKEVVNVNSGFIIAFDISYAVDAIHKNPVGPLRASK